MEAHVNFAVLTDARLPHCCATDGDDDFQCCHCSNQGLKGNDQGRGLMDNELRSIEMGKKLLRGSAAQQLLGIRGAALIVKVQR